MVDSKGKTGSIQEMKAFIGVTHKCPDQKFKAHRWDSEVDLKTVLQWLMLEQFWQPKSIVLD